MEKQKYFIQLHLHDKKDEEFTISMIKRNEIFSLIEMESYRNDSNPKITIFAISQDGTQSLDVNLMNEVDFERRNKK